MTQVAEQSQECEQETLFQLWLSHSHALSQLGPGFLVKFSSFKDLFFFWGGVFSCDKWEFCTVVLCDCYTTEQASKEFVRPQIMFFKKLEEPVKILIFGSPETSPSSWRAVKFNLSRFQDHFPSSKEGAIPWAGHRKNHKWVPLLFFFAVKSALLPPLIFCITRGFIPWRLSGVTMREFIICGTKCRWLFIGP